MLRSPIKIHGGKRYLYKWLISQFPDNYEEFKYIEACAGGANVLLNKKPSKEEVYNDLDSGLYNLFNCLKTESASVMEAIDKLPYGLTVFEVAKYSKNNNTSFYIHESVNVTKPVELAVREVVLRRMSRGGLGTHFSWSERKRGGQPGDVNSWNTFKLQLPDICNRLKDVKVYNEHVVDLFHKLDAPDVLWYIDPSYLPSTRTVPSVYNIEMTEDDHVILANVLNEAKGKVVLSGYYSPLYAKMYKGWKMDTKEIANHSAQSKKKQRRIECIWKNF